MKSKKVKATERPNLTAFNRILAVVACAVMTFAVACGGSGSSTSTTPPPPTGSNVLPIAVNAGPAGNYANGAFASVTVCVPGTSSCQTIDGVLVDTGSSGLRVLLSALTVPLPQQDAADGNPVDECLPFLIGYTWGPIQTGDIELAGEKASSVPIQVISGTAPAPSICASNPGGPEDTLSALGANGILGVGSFPQDCGGACALPPSTPQNPTQNPNLYYECPASGCTAIAEGLSQQVQNPVALFSSDNNGVIVELPSVSGPVTNLSGSLVFGIGTQSNNGLGSATVYSIDDFGNFISTFNNAVYNQSFIDSGSNGFFFPDTSIPTCADLDDDFYCPSSTENLSATNEGATGAPSATVNFSVANADTLFNNNPNASVFGQLAGPNSIDSFDWGLPFFYGRNVYTSIAGATAPGGTTPYWAY